MKKRFTRILAALALLVGLTIPMGMWGQTRESYNVTYSYDDLGDMLYGSYLDASSYWKVPETSGNNAVISIPITYQPESDITVTFCIATFGSGNNPSSSNTTITAAGIESNSNWSGSGVSSYPSSSTYVNGVMTITKPQNPTTLGGLDITMGVNTGVKIFRLQSVSVSYTYSGGTPTPTTYTVTFDAGQGTFVGSEDFPAVENEVGAGEYTLPSATRDGYTFNGWALGENTYAGGASYTVNGDAAFVASYTENTTPGSESLTFDFEDETAHRTSGTNSYTENEYEENGADIILTYADAVNSGSPLSGSYHVLGRIAKNTTNSPVVLIGPIDITNWTITKIEYLTKGVSAMSQVFETSLDGSQWTSQLSINSMPTSVATETVNDLSITGTELYLRWTVSVASQTGSNRDFNLDDIVITYTEASNPVPSFTINNNNELAYNATSGSFTFTVNNPVDGGETTIDENVEWISGASITGNTVNYTTTSNEATTPRQGIITLTYTYGDNETVTKDVTVTQAAAPVIYTTIPALFAAATNNETNVLVTFNNWVVSGSSSKNVFVTDNNGNGFVIFDNDGGLTDIYTAGDILSGTAVTCTLLKYNGFAELKNVNATDLTITAGGTVTTANIAMASLDGVNTGALVHYDNLTCSVNNNKYYLTDGTTTLQVYNALFAFEALEDGKTYNITGVYQQYNSTKEILPRSAADIEEVEIPSITADNINILATATSGEIVYTINHEVTGGVMTAAVAGGDWLTLANDYTSPISFACSTNTGDARQVTVTLTYTYNRATVTKDVTISQAAYVAPASGTLYALYTGDLVEGDYLIVYNGKAMNNVVASNRLQYAEVTATNNVIATENDAIVWHIAPSGDYWTIYSADAEEYAASTGTKNQATMMADGTDDKALWTVSDAYEFVNKYNSENNVNSNLRNNGTYGFACYATSTGGALSLYKKVALDIAGYGNSAGGYYLIASPVTSVTPSTANGFIAATAADYDLYSFDQAGGTDGKEWRNYKVGDGFDLVSGKGYLYASKANTTLAFAGTPYSGNGEFSLAKSGTGTFSGWNLIGNPFNETAYLQDGRDFYVMNEGGTGLTAATSNGISAMQGVFVLAASNNETVTFTTTEPTVVTEGVVLNLSKATRGASTIDRAIVRFGEGSTLPKFQLFENSTKLYIPQGNNDYAVVRSAAEAEMPVSFKAEKNGTYTLNIEAENVNMNYLHLIDNMTGMDVDLLQTPSYTFEAKTSDYASRFRLVFKASSTSSEADETFAYFNGTNWTISNVGDATLQVVDVTGRTVANQMINGNAELNLNQPAGVYVIRLVNGDNVKTQKVVVR